MHTDHGDAKTKGNTAITALMKAYKHHTLINVFSLIAKKTAA
jgi:hypothetical protein